MDSPLFNAGKGAVFTHDKKNELDASIMDGKTLNAGAVASVTTVKTQFHWRGLSLQEATKEIIQNKLPKLGGDGGVVAIDGTGNVAMEFNTAGMFRASMDKNGKLYIGIYKN